MANEAAGSHRLTMPSPGSNRLVLVDRDGTINREKHYLSSPDQVELLPNAAEGIRLLNRLGLPVLVVSNQSGIARGFFSQETLNSIHERLSALLAEEGADLDGIYSCPHRPEDECNCRKPRPGLAIQAAADFEGDLSRSFIIGDNRCDLELGAAINATSILVRTGYGAELALSDDVDPQLVVDDLLAAAHLLQQRVLESGS